VVYDPKYSLFMSISLSKVKKGFFLATVWRCKVELDQWYVLRIDDLLGAMLSKR